MKFLRCLFLVLPGLFVLPLRAADTYAPFTPDLAAGAAYRIDAAQLHPTQSSVGFREVAYKRQAIDKLSGPELVAYLEDKDVPVVIGPQGVPYMTDGHHTIRALLDSRQADKTVYGHILANWSARPAAEFWQEMHTRNYTYLKDADGQPITPAALPRTLREVQHDIYRGLAWAMMKADGFAEIKPPKQYFQEFFWADFLRAKVKWNDADEADFARVLKESLALARTPAAAHLPGFKPAK